jgi:predicted dehydrogenase
MRQLRIAVVGAGSRAQQHLETLSYLPSHYQVAGISDLSRSRAETAAARFQAPAYVEPLRMLDETRPDAVLVVVPPDGHHPLVVAAAARGIHVLCEVPISITLPLADLMIDACQRAGVVLEICENVPRTAKERVKREVIRRGLLGEILVARLQYASGSYHGLSAVRRLLPGTAVRAWGFRRTLPALPQREFSGLVHDTQQWEFGYFSFETPSPGTASGHTSSVTLLYEQPPRPGARNTWEIVGTRGRITDQEVHLLEEAADGRRREVSYPIIEETRAAQRTDGTTIETLVRAVVPTDPPVVWENPDADLGLPASRDDVARGSQLLTFHRAVTEGVAPEYGAREARTDLELLLALRESARHGSVPINLPLRELTDHERALHEEYRLTYGQDPLAPPEETAAAFFPRGGITHGVTHERIAEIDRPDRD